LPDGAVARLARAGPQHPRVGPAHGLPSVGTAAPSAAWSSRRTVGA
jgi:hypothetical protein